MLEIKNLPQKSIWRKVFHQDLTYQACLHCAEMIDLKKPYILTLQWKVDPLKLTRLAINNRVSRCSISCLFKSVGLTSSIKVSVGENSLERDYVTEFCASYFFSNPGGPEVRKELS